MDFKIIFSHFSLYLYYLYLVKIRPSKLWLDPIPEIMIWWIVNLLNLRMLPQKFRFWPIGFWEIFFCCIFLARIRRPLCPNPTQGVLIEATWNYNTLDVFTQVLVLADLVLRGKTFCIFRCKTNVHLFLIIFSSKRASVMFKQTWISFI